MSFLSLEIFIRSKQKIRLLISQFNEGEMGRDYLDDCKAGVRRTRELIAFELVLLISLILLRFASR